jgi:DNA-binding transcriptional ArsR family regulator
MSITVIIIENRWLMAKTQADLILHPVRLRMMTELAGRQMTPRQLANALPDIPQATLYRHIKTLVDGGILEVVAEEDVNGSVERTYAVVKGAGRLSGEELQMLSAEEHLRYFTIYAVKLIEDFAAYLRTAQLEENSQNAMSYNTASIYLTDAERAQFQEAVIAVVGRAMSNAPAPDRKCYNLSSIVIPGGKDSP